MWARRNIPETCPTLCVLCINVCVRETYRRFTRIRLPNVRGIANPTLTIGTESCPLTGSATQYSLTLAAATARSATAPDPAARASQCAEVGALSNWPTIARKD